MYIYNKIVVFRAKLIFEFAQPGKSSLRIKLIYVVKIFIIANKFGVESLPESAGLDP